MGLLQILTSQAVFRIRNFWNFGYYLYGSGSVSQQTKYWENLNFVHFLLRTNVHFWNQYTITDFFYAPFDLSKEKSFHLTEEPMCTFYELKKVQNASNYSLFRKTFFYEQVLDFHRSNKILCQTSERQNHWSLLNIWIIIAAGRWTMDVLWWRGLLSQDLGPQDEKSLLPAHISGLHTKNS